ncbi:ATP cone domain-containing protein, partial [Gilliamella sp. Occ4-3]|uniref:ATP cone domain-containing protein n=2 Tax=Gilliamella TaxID=1193503 RepID=UPI001C539941
MNKSILVTKRDGKKEPINLDKIHRVITWAAEGLENVSVSQVELRSHIQFYDGIRTSDIHETIIRAAADLISQEAPDYQYLAARLAIFHLRKKAFNQFTPPSLYEHVKKLV